MNQANKKRLDVKLVERGLVSTRSQAESYIKLKKVSVNGQIVNKSGYQLSNSDVIGLEAGTQYVSRAALKLQSIVSQFDVNFKDKNVLDVGSSTGGFTDYSLKQGASRVIAIEVGSQQLHPSLRSNPAIELHEKTDIRDVLPYGTSGKGISLKFVPDIVLIDLSFVSLRQVLSQIANLVDQKSKLIVMVKPQFEAQESGMKHKGVIKNETIRRTILRDFETWVNKDFIIINKLDSKITGAKGNLERFYLLSKVGAR